MSTNTSQNGPVKPGLLRDYLNTLREFSPNLRRFLLFITLTFMTGLGLVAVLQNLYLLRLGFDVQFLGLLVGIGQIVWAAGALPAGILSNRIGLRNGLMLGSVLLGLGLVLTLLVETRPESQWRIWLIACQVITGFGPAFLAVNLPPYVMAVTGEKERRHAFAAIAATNAAAVLVGSLIGGALPVILAGRLNLTSDQPEPYRLALWLGPVLLLIGLSIMARNDRARVIHTNSIHPGEKNAPVALLLFFGLVAFLGAIGEGTLRAFYNVYLDTGLKVTPAVIGAIMGMAQLLPIGAAFALPLLMKRWGTGYTLMAGFLGAGIVLIFLSAIPAVWVAAAAYMGIVAMFTISNTSRDMLGQEIVLPRWRTSSQGAATIGMALGWSAGGIGGGYFNRDQWIWRTLSRRRAGRSAGRRAAADLFAQEKRAHAGARTRPRTGGGRPAVGARPG